MISVILSFVFAFLTGFFAMSAICKKNILLICIANIFYLLTVYMIFLFNFGIVAIVTIQFIFVGGLMAWKRNRKRNKEQHRKEVKEVEK